MKELGLINWRSMKKFESLISQESTKKKIFDENFDEKEKLILEINEEKETIWGCIKFLSNAEKLKKEEKKKLMV
jgi:hypothetical protein